MSPPLIANPPARARVVEVGPRDGLQNQAQRIPVETKRAWIERLSAAGIREIEVTSFVHPRWVPQLSDARELVRALGEAGSTLYSALVPNLRGLEDALAGGIHRIALFTAASETFNRRNINCGIEESLDRFRRIFDRLGREAGAGVHVRAYISTSFGCPYEGTVPPERVAEIAAELREMGAREIAVSDTTGVATPPQVEDVITTVAEAVPLPRIALHLHDTRGMALANVVSGLGLGITAFDASSGGLGGCPYAPGAAGNLATEDLVTLLHSFGIETGIDLAALIDANLWFETHFPQAFPGRVLSAARAHRQGNGGRHD